jgi:biofilm protein TabA
MIVDALANWERYRALNPRFAAAFEFLSKAGSQALEPAEHGSQNSLRVPIQGDAVFALVQRYRPKAMEDAFWEAHRRFIDVQFVVQGAELMLWAPLASMTTVNAYDEVRDFTKLAPSGCDETSRSLRVAAGMFAIFMPDDAHAPGIAIDDATGDVKKIVVKVAV